MYGGRVPHDLQTTLGALYKMGNEGTLVNELNFGGNLVLIMIMLTQLKKTLNRANEKRTELLFFEVLVPNFKNLKEQISKKRRKFTKLWGAHRTMETVEKPRSRMQRRNFHFEDKVNLEKVGNCNEIPEVTSQRNQRQSLGACSEGSYRISDINNNQIQGYLLFREVQIFRKLEEQEQ